MMVPELIAFPEFDVVTSVVPVCDGVPSRLHPSVKAVLLDATPGRAREFAAGRQAAAQALALLGFDRAEVRCSPYRYPLWPEGVVGSISHSRDLAGAAVTRDGRLACLGFDLEKPCSQGWRDRAPMIMTELEFERCARLSEERFAARLALVASCKESVYKAVYPVFHEYLDFPDLELELDDASGAFLARPTRAVRADALIARGRGSYGTLRGQIVSIFGVVEDRLSPASRFRFTGLNRPG